MEKELKLGDYADAIQLNEKFEEPSGADTLNDIIEWFQKNESELFNNVLFLMNRNKAMQNRTDYTPEEILRGFLNARDPEPLPDQVQHMIDQYLVSQRKIDAEADDIKTLRDCGYTFEGADRLCLWKGDITHLRVDAIVNAANSALLGCRYPLHSCIDNAIHNSAGPRLRDDCNKIICLQGHEEGIGLCKITRGYCLPSRFVLHTVGPWLSPPYEPTPEDEQALKNSYKNCLECANEMKTIASVAFCSISTGVFKYPIIEATKIAIKTVLEYLKSRPTIKRVIFDVFSDHDYNVYQSVIDNYEEQNKVK